MTECVLLDAGGVLLDLDYAYLRRLIDARGVEVSEGDLSRFEAMARKEVNDHVATGGSTAERWRDYFQSIIFAAGLREVDVQEAMIDSLWEAHRRFGLWTVAIPGAIDAVRRLHEAGIPVGVVSNAEGRVEQDLNDAGFDGLLKTVVDSHVVGVAKPDPEIFRIALQQMGANADSTVFVGDVPAVDVAGARAAGLRAFLLDRHDLYPGSDAPRLGAIEQLPDRVLEDRS